MAEEEARSWGISTASTEHEGGLGRNGLLRKFRRVNVWLTKYKKSLLSEEGPEILEGAGHFGLDDARREVMSRRLPDSDPESVAGKKRLRLEEESASAAAKRPAGGQGEARPIVMRRPAAPCVNAELEARAREEQVRQERMMTLQTMDCTGRRVVICVSHQHVQLYNGMMV